MTDPTTAHNTPPPRASAEDWARIDEWIELRNRVEALEAAAAAAADHFPGVRKMVTPTPTAAPAGETNHQWLGGVAVPNDDGWMITQVQPPAAAPAGGVTEEEEVAEMLVAACTMPARAAAHYILNHPRIGPLLRGEGGKRVVLQESPPVSELQAGCPTGNSLAEIYWGACHRTWATARAELARQQGEGS